MVFSWRAAGEFKLILRVIFEYAHGNHSILILLICDFQTPVGNSGESPIGDLAEAQIPELDLIVAVKWITRSFKKGNLTLLIKEAKGLTFLKNSLPSTFVKW